MAVKTYVEMGIYDLTAKDDLTARCEGGQPFTDLAVFSREAARWKKYATLEPGRFVLDGTMELFPEDMETEDWGLWSTALSDAAGTFSQPPVLEFSFGEEHSSVGLTFYFDEPTGETGGWVLVEWFDEKGQELARHRRKAEGAVWFMQKRVERYRQVRITFLGTGTPYRYLKLAGIEFGTRKEFGPDGILAARLLEEADPLCSELPVGQLELEVLTPEADFSILDPEGVFYGLRQRQALRVTGERNGEQVPFGVYYLNSWECGEETKARFVATDAMGLLEAMPYEGGMVEARAGVLIADIMGEVAYELDAELAAAQCRGWLPVCTRREALQQVVFAIGGVVDTSRGAVVQIYPPGERALSYISYDRKVLGGSEVALLPQVTAVAVTAHSYEEGAQEECLLEESLAAGSHVVQLEAPATGYRAEGARIQEAGANLVRLMVDSGGMVRLYGRPYVERTLRYERQAKAVPLYAEENVLAVEEATLIGPALADVVAKRVLDRKAERYTQSFRMPLAEERLADTVVVSSARREKLRGKIVRMEIDLAGGWMTDVTVTGTRVDSRWRYFTGEIWANGGALV